MCERDRLINKMRLHLVGAREAARELRELGNTVELRAGSGSGYLVSWPTRIFVGRQDNVEVTI